jgi:3-(methylthio)propionyl---CoA ligase
MTDGTMQDYPLTLNKFLEHAAKWHPTSGIATAGDGGIARVTYADALIRARQVSAVLRDLGTRPGMRVATLAWNSQHHVEVWYAVMGMGAVCHTLNPRLTTAQLAAMAVQSEARILVVSADLVPMAMEIAFAVPALEQVLVIDGAPEAAAAPAGARLDSLEDLLRHAGTDVEWGDFPETSPSGLCFTSGSTGAPKGVTYTHRSGFLHTLRLLQADMAALRATDVVLPVVPMFHANAWGFPFAAPAVGARLAMPGRRTDGASLARLIAAEGVTVAIGVPTVWLGLCEHVEAAGITLDTLDRVTVGGSQIAPALMQRIERTLGVHVQTSWGMTEMSPVGVFAPPADPGRRAEVSGRPAIGVDLMLADAAGAPLPEQRGREGHLHVRGASVIERYFGFDHGACTAEGWFDTGDLAQIDAAGNLTITGRAKDLIKSGGEWINPAEIESLVGALSPVSLAAVIGRAHDKWGERPLLLIELRDGQDIPDEAILESLRGRIASWWIPDAVIRVPAMPLASTGKIDKLSLRSQYGRAIP